jgi:hypothetical protein
MKIRFAILAALVLASAVACTQSPTSLDSHRRTPAPGLHTGETIDTTTARNGGAVGSGH